MGMTYYGKNVKKNIKNIKKLKKEINMDRSVVNCFFLEIIETSCIKKIETFYYYQKNQTKQNFKFLITCSVDNFAGNKYANRLE